MRVLDNLRPPDRPRFNLSHIGTLVPAYLHYFKELNRYEHLTSFKNALAPFMTPEIETQLAENQEALLFQEPRPANPNFPFGDCFRQGWTIRLRLQENKLMLELDTESHSRFNPMGRAVTDYRHTQKQFVIGENTITELFFGSNQASMKDFPPVPMPIDRLLPVTDTGDQLKNINEVTFRLIEAKRKLDQQAKQSPT